LEETPGILCQAQTAELRHQRAALPVFYLHIERTWLEDDEDGNESAVKITEVWTKLWSLQSQGLVVQFKMPRVSPRIVGLRGLFKLLEGCPELTHLDLSGNDLAFQNNDNDLGETFERWFEESDDDLPMTHLNFNDCKITGDPNFILTSL
jgi:hypothetical protein